MIRVKRFHHLPLFIMHNIEFDVVNALKVSVLDARLSHTTLVKPVRNSKDMRRQGSADSAVMNLLTKGLRKAKTHPVKFARKQNVKKCSKLIAKRFILVVIHAKDSMEKNNVYHVSMLNVLQKQDTKLSKLEASKVTPTFYKKE